MKDVSEDIERQNSRDKGYELEISAGNDTGNNAGRIEAA